MKLKQQPNDFRVEEIATATPSDGPYAFYRLEKINWTTPDALNKIRRRWNIPINRLSYGGLKDRHARTIQFFTVFHGPQRNFTHPGIDVEYLGQREQPFSSTDMEANRFTLTLRSMSPAAVEQAQAAVPELERVGVPNYFDDQRFSSVGSDGRFVAKAMVLGNFEDALKIALTVPYEHDRAAMKKEKSLLRGGWGNWSTLKDQLPPGHARGLVDFLRQHPDDFRGAVERLKPELRGLYLSAWQSHLWNKMLALWIRTHVSGGQVLYVRNRLGELPLPRSLRAEKLDEWKTLSLPLPSARLKIEPEAPWAGLVEEVMAEEGLPLEDMKLKSFRKPFFSKGDRTAAVIPSQLSAETDKDELNEGKRKLILRFDLPRGCYATMIVKRLTQVK